MFSFVYMGSIKQMCLLFSLCAITENDQKILTWISIIPSIPFTKKNASSWFGIQKNSTLKRLFDQGLPEIEHGNTTQKYWMHSVIAAAIREQKKDILYDETRPFIERLSRKSLMRAWRISANPNTLCLCISLERHIRK